MKNFTQNIISLVLLGVIFFVFQTSIINGLLNIRDYFFPCNFSITYSLGVIDNRFGLTENEFLQAVKEAEDIWEKAVDKDLFNYKKDGYLKINLIYDNRQDTTNTLNNLDSKMADDKNLYNILKTEYDDLKNEIDRSRNNLNSQEEVDAFNQKVNKLNDLSKKINQHVKGINSQVDDYNQIGDSLGGEFEEGLYHSDKNGRGIDIYQFKDHTTLVRLLVHEMGHALSLEHTNNLTDIMYPINSAKNLKLTENDMNAIKTHCQIR